MSTKNLSRWNRNIPFAFNGEVRALWLVILKEMIDMTSESIIEIPPDMTMVNGRNL